MPRPDLMLITIAAVCVLPGALLNRAQSRWRNVGRALLLATASCATGAVIVAWRTSQQALGSGAELLVLTAAATLLWHSIHAAAPSGWASLVLGVVASLLLGWAFRIGWSLPASAQNGPQAWRATAHVLLALAYGRFFETGCTWVAQHWPAQETQPSACAATPGNRGAQELALALFFLSASLLWTMVATWFVTGTWWGWTAAESWTLILLLWQAIIWWGSAWLQWKGHVALLVRSLGVLATWASLYALVR